jgi:hypothetical protein
MTSLLVSRKRPYGTGYLFLRPTVVAVVARVARGAVSGW